MVLLFIKALAYIHPQLLIQLAIVCCAEREDTSVDIDIEIDFNPCSVKKCGENEECRVVAHSELLQIPVAVCIETKKANEGIDLNFVNISSYVVSHRVGGAGYTRLVVMLI